MAFTKITSSDLNSRGATTLPNQPKISATALKQEFDAPAKEVVAPKFNNLIDELEATSAAADIGAVAPAGRTGETVQAVMNKLSVDLKTVEDGMSEAIAEAHSHPNKELLDTYTQTEEDIAQAIADDHTHANKELLDSYTQSDEDITDAISAMHTHDNKDLLDTYTQTESDLADAVDKKHSHSNKSVLDKFGESSGEPTYDGNPIGGGSGDMLASDYDPNDTVKNAGGIVDYVDSQAYELPAATSNTLGGVMQGTNVSIDANGVISATDTTYSDATTSQSGLMSATDKTKLDGIEANANNYSLPTASTSQLGGVKVDGTTVTIDANGVISSTGGSGAADAYKTVKVGTSNIVASGEDTLELVAGSNVTLTPDTSLKKVTISASGGGASTGDMLAADYDSDFDVKTAGGIKSYVAGLDYVAKSSTAGLLKNDGSVDQTQYVSDISGKTDKVTGAVSGNFAALTITGNLTDSGKKASDFMASDGVEANPSGSATGSLSKLRIGSSIYSIEGGGGTTIVQIPSVVGDSFTYNGISQGPTITGLDSTHCTVTGATAVNAGTYTLTIALNDPSSMVWSDLTTADKTYSYTIAKATQTITASKNSVSLTGQQPSDTITISGQQTSLNVSSSDTGVATVSESSGTVTITGVATGNATVSVYAEETANYAQSATVSISVSAVLGRNITIYSAANDTVSFTDAIGSKTVTTDSSGVGTASIAISGSSQSITFTSSVAKSTTDASQPYSKTVTVNSNTTSVSVMPDNALYWFGNECAHIMGSSITKLPNWQTNCEKQTNNLYTYRSGSGNIESGFIQSPVKTFQPNTYSYMKTHYIATGTINPQNTAGRMPIALRKASDDTGIADNYMNIIQEASSLTIGSQAISAAEAYTARLCYVWGLQDISLKTYSVWFE